MLQARKLANDCLQTTPGRKRHYSPNSIKPSIPGPQPLDILISLRRKGLQQTLFLCIRVRIDGNSMLQLVQNEFVP